MTYRTTDDGVRASIVTDGRTVDLDDVGSIWCRGVKAEGFPPEIGAADQRFAEAESERMLTALYTIADVVWINHPHRHIRANSKPAQIAVASKVGLDIPATVITNDPDEVRRFIAGSGDKTVYKTLSQSLNTEMGKSLFTSIMTDSAVENLDLIGITPGIFQQLVPKAYELRVTVVGSRVFSARINSQSRPETSIDWRRLPFAVDAVHDLPPDIETKIQAVMKAFGLIYGAFDFIVTPDSRYVFLVASGGTTCGSKRSSGFRSRPPWSIR